MKPILIVEDDPDIRDGVRILLAGEGYHILEAENGLRALELFDPEVDLVILDIMMPGMKSCARPRRCPFCSLPQNRRSRTSCWA